MHKLKTQRGDRQEEHCDQDEKSLRKGKLIMLKDVEGCCKDVCGRGEFKKCFVLFLMR